MRRGILGGTFDPIHIGHLLLAEEARLRLPLDRVMFVPAGSPWRKSRDITPAADRLAMVRMAVSGNACFDVSDLEVQREGPSYSADTLAGMAEDGDDLFLLLGADALIDLPNWHRPADLVSLARIVVARRPGWDDDAMAAAAAQVGGLTERLIALTMPLIEVSATDIRDRARRGEPLRYLVPDAVAAYIRERALYPPGSTDTALASGQTRHGHPSGL